MKVLGAIKRLQEIYEEHGDLDFGTAHYPHICRTDHETFTWCMEIHVVETYGGRTKTAVAK
jgi:hypothetical protein